MRSLQFPLNKLVEQRLFISRGLNFGAHMWNKLHFSGFFQMLKRIQSSAFSTMSIWLTNCWSLSGFGSFFSLFSQSSISSAGSANWPVVHSRPVTSSTSLLVWGRVSSWKMLWNWTGDLFSRSFLRPPIQLSSQKLVGWDLQKTLNYITI